MLMARPPRIANRLPMDRATIYFLTFCVEDRKAVLANDRCWQASWIPYGVWIVGTSWPY
jgi:hypothetical protein